MSKRPEVDSGLFLSLFATISQLKSSYIVEVDITILKTELVGVNLHGIQL